MKRSILHGIAAAGVLVLLIALAARAPLGGRNDPLPSYRFRVEIEGVEAGQFASVEGLSCETEVIEYREGGDSNMIRLLPGLTRCGPVTLSKGLTADSVLWDWYNQMVQGDLQRRSMSIIVMDYKGNEARRYNLFECFPVSYKLGEFDAGNNDKMPLIEKITLAVERIELG
ncbi:MAG TPA: phage tail protein [Thermoplasmata archaeon]|nr:phage tail protein [Thermoplasmata archaeon]